MSQETQSQQEFIPMNYYLFSITMKIDGQRVYRDIPLYSHKLLFPKRTDIYAIACKFFEVEPEIEGQWQSFAIMNVYKFESQEDYLSYIGELNIS